MDTHVITVLLLDGVLPLDATIPAHVFLPSHGLPYTLIMAGEEAGEVQSSGGFGIMTRRGLDALEEADTVIVPGYSAAGRSLSEPTLDALRTAHVRGARMVSICTGTFALAEAGLLDGRRAATHWQLADKLAERYPEIDVDRRVLFVDDGDILTSAGVAAGIDLCLHLIRRDHGVYAANDVARAIVAAPYRSGGQSQFVPRALGKPAGELFALTRQWALENLSEPLTLNDLARHAHVSRRTFSRRFVEDTGHPPLQWLLRARVDLARELLEATDLGIDEVAERSGLGTATNLRTHFRRVLGSTPRDYRRTFSTRTAVHETRVA